MSKCGCFVVSIKITKTSMFDQILPPYLKIVLILKRSKKIIFYSQILFFTSSFVKTYANFCELT